jgi:hypothetical protein
LGACLSPPPPPLPVCAASNSCFCIPSSKRVLLGIVENVSAGRESLAEYAETDEATRTQQDLCFTLVTQPTHVELEVGPRVLLGVTCVLLVRVWRAMGVCPGEGAWVLGARAPIRLAPPRI